MPVVGFVQRSRRHQRRGFLRRSENRRSRRLARHARRVRQLRVGVRPPIRSAGVGLHQRFRSAHQVQRPLLIRYRIFVFSSTHPTTTYSPGRAGPVYETTTTTTTILLFYRYLHFVFDGPIRPQDHRVIYQTLARTPSGVAALIEFLAGQWNRTLNDVVNGEQVVTSVYALLASKVADDDEIAKVRFVAYALKRRRSYVRGEGGKSNRDRVLSRDSSSSAYGFVVYNLDGFIWTPSFSRRFSKSIITTPPHSALKRVVMPVDRWPETRPVRARTDPTRV